MIPLPFRYSWLYQYTFKHCVFYIYIFYLSLWPAPLFNHASTYFAPLLNFAYQISFNKTPYNSSVPALSYLPFLGLLQERARRNRDRTVSSDHRKCCSRLWVTLSLVCAIVYGNINDYPENYSSVCTYLQDFPDDFCDNSPICALFQCHSCVCQYLQFPTTQTIWNTHLQTWRHCGQCKHVVGNT